MVPLEKVIVFHCALTVLGTEIEQSLLRGIVDMLFDLGNASRSTSAAEGSSSSSR